MSDWVCLQSRNDMQTSKAICMWYNFVALKAVCQKTGTSFYLTAAASHVQHACLPHTIMTSNEQCFCYMWCVYVSHIKTFLTWSFNLKIKNVILILVQRTKMHGPWPMANWNSDECCATCHHDKWSKWRVMQFIG